MAELTAQFLDEMSRERHKRERNMKEYFPPIGYFSKEDCEIIKGIMDDKTFMHFKVSYSNYAGTGNCSLIVRTDYDDTEENIINFFLFALVDEFCKLARYWKQA